MTLFPLPLPHRLEPFRIGVVDFEMNPGSRKPETMRKGALVVCQQGRVRYQVAGSMNGQKQSLDRLLMTLRLHLHHCDYLAGYGGTELAVLSSLCLNPLGGRYIDVLAAVRWRYPRLESYSLAAVCRTLGIESGAGTTIDDALAAWECLQQVTGERRSLQ